MVNLNSSAYWRVVDVGHAALRWQDELLIDAQSGESPAGLEESHQRRAGPFSSRGDSSDDQVSAQCAPHSSLLNLCELALHQREPAREIAPHFPHWSSLAQLCTSKSLGSLGVMRHTDDSLWINTGDEQVTPRALLARWLAQHLPPEMVLGDTHATSAIHGLLWVRSLGHSPLLSARIYQALAELPFPSGGSLSQGIATLMGMLNPDRISSSLGVWGVLDVGSGSASWSLIEVSSSSQGHIHFDELSGYRQSWVGERALMRALLNDHLNQRRLMWRELSTSEQSDWVKYTSTQAAELLHLSWPQHLQRALFPGATLDEQSRSGSSLQVFRRFQHGTYLALAAWISHSLAQHQIGPEALRGVWVTGLQGGALISKLRRLYASVNFRVASPTASLKGARYFTRFTLSDHPTLRYRVREVSLCALRLFDHDEEVSRSLLDEQTQLPVMLEVDVGPTGGNLSLQLSTYGGPQMTLATHPPIKERRTLRLYYEGPHLFELEWVASHYSDSSSPDEFDDQWRSI